MQVRSANCLDFSLHLLHDDWCERPKPTLDRACNNRSCDQQYFWSSQAWSECPTTNIYNTISQQCNAENQTRTVDCVSEAGFAVPQLLCSNSSAAAAAKPSTIAVCDPRPYSCVQFDWQRISTSPCSRSCGSGISSQSVNCIISQFNSVVDDQYCTSFNSSNIKPAPIVTCTYYHLWTATAISLFIHICALYCLGNTTPCISYSFVVSAFSPCNVSCGGGVQTRSVLCYDSNAQLSNFSNCIDVYATTISIPHTQQTCNSQSCNWRTHNFTLCTAPCSNHSITPTQSRSVECVDRDDRIVDNSNCFDTMKPITVQSCNTPACCNYILIIHLSLYFPFSIFICSFVIRLEFI